MVGNIIGAFRALKADNKAVTAIEYALIAALIAVVIIGAVSAHWWQCRQHLQHRRYRTLSLDDEVTRAVG